jgi:thioredoxin reductase (NADPH)
VPPAAQAKHSAEPSTPLRTDALVIGAGPVGLFLVFELGLLGISAQVVDASPVVGGQPVELYGHKPIYDIPAVPVCTGQELVDRLRQQIEPFHTPFYLDQTVCALTPQPGGGFLVESSAGVQWLAKTVFIAAGVGAFQPKRLKVDGLDAFEGSQLLYRVPQPQALAGQRVVVVGGDDTALDWALRLSEPGDHAAASVVLVHRRDAFQADAATEAAVRARCRQGGMHFQVGQITGHHQSGRLTDVDITTPDGSTQILPLDILLVCGGLSPQLGPISQWGLAMERKQLVVDTAQFSTAVPGIFAVGDINTYPGKRKLIVCGFHEATLAAYGAAALLWPQQPVVLQYTSSSSHLHRLLGVAATAPSPAPNASTTSGASG